MSEIRVTTLKDTSGGSSSTTAQIASGRAKAWVNFDGTGAVTIRANFNVNSITDNNTGDYTVNFSTSFSDTNYCVVTGTSGNANSTNGNEFYVSTQIAGPSYNAAFTATGSIRMTYLDGAGINRDVAVLNIAIYR